MATGSKPRVIVLGGPNGAGKSTAARQVLTGPLQVREFVNADTIAHGLSAFSPQNVALKAGRIMLTQLKELAAARESFAFEITLAGRSFAPWIQELIRNGYLFHLFYFWVPSPDFSIARVRMRVQSGGHHVPEEDIRRRYQRGLDNFFDVYRPLAHRWKCYNSSIEPEPLLIASGRGVHHERVYDRETWQKIIAFRSQRSEENSEL